MRSRCERLEEMIAEAKGSNAGEKVGRGEKERNRKGRCRRAEPGIGFGLVTERKE